MHATISTREKEIAEIEKHLKKEQAITNELAHKLDTLKYQRDQLLEEMDEIRKDYEEYQREYAVNEEHRNRLMRRDLIPDDVDMPIVVEPMTYCPGPLGWAMEPSSLWNRIHCTPYMESMYYDYMKMAWRAKVWKRRLLACTKITDRLFHTLKAEGCEFDME